jgi:hypothetical protein
MAFRLYIVPVVGIGTKDDPRRPKYFNSDAAGAGRTGIITAGSVWSAIDYGFEPWMVVGADLSTSDDNLVVGEADAFAVPFDLSVNLTSGQVTNVQNKLEAINVPAGWVDTSLTWVSVLRVVLGMFLLMQRYSGIHGTNGIFTGGVALSTTIAQLPAQVRADFQTAAQSFGLDTSSIVGGTTLRQALKILADQFSHQQYNFNGTLI